MRLYVDAILVFSLARKVCYLEIHSVITTTNNVCLSKPVRFLLKTWTPPVLVANLKLVTAGFKTPKCNGNQLIPVELLQSEDLLDEVELICANAP